MPTYNGGKEEQPPYNFSPDEVSTVQRFLTGFLACFDRAFEHEDLDELFRLMVNDDRLAASSRQIVQESISRVLHDDALPEPATMQDERFRMKLVLQRTRSIRAISRAFPKELRDQFISTATNDSGFFGKAAWLYHLDKHAVLWELVIRKHGTYGSVEHDDRLLVCASTDGLHKVLQITQYDDGTSGIDDTIESGYWREAINLEPNRLRIVNQREVVSSELYLPLPKIYGR